LELGSKNQPKLSDQCPLYLGATATVGWALSVLLTPPRNIGACRALGRHHPQAEVGPANELGGKHCHVAHPATDVQYTHPRNNSGSAKKILGERSQDARLPD